jgi:iron complex transport system substrate-binding protein
MLGALAASVAARTAQAQSRSLVDSVGRRIDVPDRVARVMAAGPPASILLYVLAPEAMVGWVPQPPAEAKPFLLPAVRELPASGRLTGRRGDAPDSERIAALKPDLIVDFGDAGANYVALAEKVQGSTRIPYALIDGAIDKSAARCAWRATCSTGASAPRRWRPTPSRASRRPMPCWPRCRPAGVRGSMSRAVRKDC